MANPFTNFNSKDKTRANRKRKKKKTQTSKFKKDEITSKQFFESRIRV